MLSLTVFILSTALAALLMFLIEPLGAKMFLPLCGGGPNVWTTCMVFYQVILLIGYLYAHLVSRLKLSKQLITHLVVVWLPVLMLPIAKPANPQTEAHPVVWILVSLTASFGPILFSLATTSPVLQKWFYSTGSKGSSDPYFLYAASNLGSLAGLLAYPTIVEPNISLSTQCHSISIAYVVLAVFLTSSAFLCYRKRGTEEINSFSSEEAPPETISFLRWIALTVIPASVLLGLTLHVTTDLVSLPLFWIIPLGVYLTTFIISFSRVSPTVVKFFRQLAPPLAFLSLASFVVPSFSVTNQMGFVVITVGSIILHLMTLFAIGLACHGWVALERPAKPYLTSYYLAIAFGGALGSIFNALVAPLIFDGCYEYPLALSLSIVFLIRWPWSFKERHYKVSEM
ncbi:MAG: spermidine synthase, partial [Cyanobacteria bacterium]|nr:spermidine synthase [Cyanobacteriota bacterium]